MLNVSEKNITENDFITDFHVLTGEDQVCEDRAVRQTAKTGTKRTVQRTQLQSKWSQAMAAEVMAAAAMAAVAMAAAAMAAAEMVAVGRYTPLCTLVRSRRRMPGCWGRRPLGTPVPSQFPPRMASVGDRA